MKKVLSVLLAIAMVFTMLGALTIGYAEDFSLTMQIGSSVMTVNGVEKTIDDEGSTPIIVNERTLLPVRAVVEEMGGTVGGEADTRTAVLNYDDKEIRLVMDSKTAYLNGEAKELDTAPAIINDRTMLPIRFIAESFDFTVGWDGDTQTVTVSKAEAEEPDVVSSATTAIEEEPTATSAPEPAQTDGKTLIAYFSRAGENYGMGITEIGNTARIAGFIADKTGYDVFEIVPVNPYPISYEETKTRATQEINDDARPEFVGGIENFDQYDTIYLGYPIWWGQMPMIIYTFLDKYDMSGKTVIPFSTAAGSGWGSSLTDLKKLCPGTTFLKGFTTAGNRAEYSQNEVNEWLEGLGE
ncbi:MAG: hypothetical protein IJH36_13925 [Clostridia bacterium]|nr:hypothetical protein [Clostridia bacterium]